MQAMRYGEPLAVLQQRPPNTVAAGRWLDFNLRDMPKALRVLEQARGARLGPEYRMADDSPPAGRDTHKNVGVREQVRQKRTRIADLEAAINLWVGLDVGVLQPDQRRGQTRQIRLVRLSDHLNGRLATPPTRHSSSSSNSGNAFRVFSTFGVETPWI